MLGQIDHPESREPARRIRRQRQDLASHGLRPPHVGQIRPHLKAHQISGDELPADHRIPGIIGEPTLEEVDAARHDRRVSSGAHGIATARDTGDRDCDPERQRGGDAYVVNALHGVSGAR